MSTTFAAAPHASADAARAIGADEIGMIEVSIVVPTFNEIDNVYELVERLDRVMGRTRWEVIYVDDDSADGTAERVREIARLDPRVRCLHRVGRRGLSKAVVEGVMSSSAPIVVVMDADLQHDEAAIPAMLNRLRDPSIDLVIGSRYCDGGSIGQWDSRRASMSRFATRLSRVIVRDELSDPMSGFFAVRHVAFREAVKRLSGEGYKVLLDLIASSPRPLRFAEVPYTFRSRVAGESKLDSAVMWQYLLLIADKKFGHIVPPRFVLFSLVGGSGVFVHFFFLAMLHRVLGVSFGGAQLAATFVAMTSNFVLNNLLTYRDRRLRGRRFLTGLMSFYAVCAIGVLANVGIANVVFERDYTWVLAGLAGIAVGTVWNYVASAFFTWRKSA